MYELKISVKKVMGRCTADPPMKPGDHFTVRDGNIRMPEGGYVCLWALQSLMPLLTPKEREIAEKKDEDWMWRVRLAQCPDPEGRVIFKIERKEKIDKSAAGTPESRAAAPPRDNDGSGPAEGGLKNLRVEVESVGGRCTSPMEPGTRITLRSGRLTLPPGGHFCLYALQAVLPLLPAKQRALEEGDWLSKDCRVLCPDPAGNVILRIDPLE